MTEPAGADAIADLSPSEADSDNVFGGALATLAATSPLTLGIGQIANLNLGNGPILGGHANIGL